MQLNNINITSFKNLQNINEDFTPHNRLTLVIGNNASGKSNFIEA